MTVKLRDFARQAGVHPSTVSRVLSGDPTARLSGATRSRILDLAAVTGYRPNRLARSLKLQRTHILGMLIPDITNPFFSLMFRAVEDVAGAAGYNVILCNTDDSAARFEQHLRGLGEGHVDGLLIATVHRSDPPMEALHARRTPCVLVNRRRDATDDAWVIPDDRLGATLAVEHLVSLGHRRIAHIAGAADISTTAKRRSSFRVALADRGLAVDERLIVEGGLTEGAGAQGMTHLLALPAEDRPTAVFAANDLAALGAIEVAGAAGLSVPEDVSIVGYNDTPLAGRARPGLTTIRVPLYDMGRLATQILIEYLEGERRPDQPPAQVVLPVELVVRGSTIPVGRPDHNASRSDTLT
jgi:LacI family transcriptional regulator